MNARVEAPVEPAMDRPEPTAASLIGQPAVRHEDHRLVTGAGRFVGDVKADGMAHGVVVRSSRAHARILEIDAEAAKAMPGVLACLTATDAARAGLGGIPWEVCPPALQARARRPGDPDVAPAQPILAVDRVRHVGEAVAFVVAESRHAALDAAEAVAIRYEDLPAVVETDTAVAEGATVLHENAPDNVLFGHEEGDAEAVERIIAAAAHVVDLKTHVPRLTPAPIEPRGYVGRYDPASGRYHLVAAAGKPHPVRNTLARFVFGVEDTAIHVTAGDIGGGFGGKNVVHAEQALVLWAARVTGRPVRWVADRLESFLTDMQSRDHRIEARLALDADGRMLALRYRSDVALGAWLAPRGVIPCLSGLKVLTGAYMIPAAHARVRAVHTNTTPTAPYRGAGVPETIFVLERLVDMAARRLGLAPAELRRRNVIAPDRLPWTTPTGTVLREVDFGRLLETADPLPPLESKTGGSLRRGVGMSLSLEAYGASFDEQAEISAFADGGVEVRIGTKSAGQSHETTYRQIAASVLEVDPAVIAVVQGDTDRIERGNGTGASRSITTGGSALLLAARALLDIARGRAAEVLQCPPERLVYREGRFEAGGALGAAVGLGELAAQSSPDGLCAKAAFRPLHVSVPAGCHVAEVEVDVETGAVALLSYRAVQDSGVAINPTVVVGQVHGGLAQGIGAALLERIRIDPETGQPLTSSFMDYAMPRADDLPAFAVALRGTPCTSNPLGAKAVGEAGPVAAPPAVVNAVIDALAPLGVEHIDLPLTPARVWEAIRAARDRSAQSMMKSKADPAGA